MTNSLYDLTQEIYVLFDDGERRLLKQTGLTVPQFNALAHLDRNQGLSLSELSRLLLCKRGNVTGIVDRLEREGLAKRVRIDHDRRYIHVVLTEKGESVRKAATSAHRAFTAQRLQVLAEADLQKAERLLEKLRDGLREHLAALPDGSETRGMLERP